MLFLRGTNSADMAVSVDYATLDETAHAGEDYVAASGTLHFAAGETNKQIPIVILNDGQIESEEQFRLVLSNPTGGVSLGSSNLLIRIQDNDSDIRLANKNVAVSEAAGVVSVLVQRGPDLNFPFTVDYATTDGSAHAGEDYVAASATLHFAAGEANKAITLTLLNDALVESEEQFNLVLSNPSGGASLADSNAVIRIWSDEAPTYYVSVNSLNPVFPYTNWATAATNIQDAVDAATGGCTVLVTNGVYAVGSREVSVLDTNLQPPEWVSIGPSRVVVTNAIRLESVNGPAVTTIDGEGGSRCVYLGSNAVLSGFTLTNGNVGDWRRGTAGGGVFCENRSAVVTNCMLMGNTAYYGVEWWNGGAGGGAYGGTLYNCTLTGNYSWRGGGAADCTLYNCTLADNHVSLGKARGAGGGAFESTSNSHFGLPRE